MKTDSAITFCKHCSRSHFGLCQGILKILSQESEFHFPRKISLAEKQYLFNQGEQLHEIYILRDGWMQLTKESEQGKHQIIRSVLPGDILGFQPDFQGPSIYSAIAIQNSVVCSIPDLLKMCSIYPELALKLVWTEACETTLSELYMANIAHRDAREKIAFMILELYQRLKLRGLNRGYTIHFPLKQEDIADTLGLTPIHVNRTLNRLRKENLLAIDKHELTILDYEKLYDLVGLELKSLEKCDMQVSCQLPCSI